MSSLPEQPAPAPPLLNVPTAVWQRRLFIALTILVVIAIVGVLFWVLGLIAGPLILLILSALAAYVLYPLIKIFQRFMPRSLAIFLVILLLLAVMGVVLYFVLVAVIEQLALLVTALQALARRPDQAGPLKPFTDVLGSLGVSQNDLRLSLEQILGYVSGALNKLFPLVGGLFGLFISGLAFATLSIYFMIDGPRFANWLRQKTPQSQRRQTIFLLDVVERAMGGFVRGQIYLAILMSIIVGLIALLVGIHYFVLIAVIVFICEFIPIVGAYISGAIGILLAFISVGWQSALIYAILVTLVQGGLDGQILGPRILGRSVGLHPIIAIFVLFVGSQLFGLIGALLACPVAGIVQTFIVAYWQTLYERRPDEFAEEKQERIRNV